MLQTLAKYWQNAPSWTFIWHLGLASIVIALVGFACGRYTLAGQLDQVLGASTQLDQTEILRLINLERAKRGLSAVTLNEQLSAAALSKGQHMFNRDYWAHVDPDGLEPWHFIQEQEYAYQSAGENLARDYSDEQDLLTAWMSSPTHRGNILNGNFSEAGLAILEGTIGGQPVILVINFFAQPRRYLGWLPQTAVYDQNSDQVVLAGQIVPTWEYLSLPRRPNSWWEVAFVVVVLTGIGLVLLKLKQKPYGRKRQLLWR